MKIVAKTALSLLWSIATLFIGVLLIVPFLAGFSTSSFILYVSLFIVLGLVLIVVAVLPFFVFTLRLSNISILQKLVRMIFFLLIVVLLFFTFGPKPNGVLISLPVPLDTVDYKYTFATGEGFGAYNAWTKFSFYWDKPTSLEREIDEEKVEKMRRTARLYEDYAQRKGGRFGAFDPEKAWLDVPILEFITCEELIDKKYSEYTEQVQRGQTIRSLSSKSEFGVTCYLEDIKWFGGILSTNYNIEINENGGRIIAHF